MNPDRRFGPADRPQGKETMNMTRKMVVLSAMFGVVVAPAVIGAEPRTYYRTIEIDGLEIFYREAGDPSAPHVLLLHGFPTSSQMFRNLIPALSDNYHVVAPDYPGYGNSSMPGLEEFEYTFDRMAQIIETFTEQLGLETYTIYLMDYGAPIGFRLAAKEPERG